MLTRRDTSRRSTRACKRSRGTCCKLDRKSTRLNSSHVRISYAVFCLNNKTSDKKNMVRELGSRDRVRFPSGVRWFGPPVRLTRPCTSFDRAENQLRPHKYCLCQLCVA